MAAGLDANLKPAACGPTIASLYYGDNTMKATQLLHNLGQSLWLDNITRDLLDNGTLQPYIDELTVGSERTKVRKVSNSESTP